MTKKICRLRINGETVSAYCGDLLLDAAMNSGIDIPHDCRSGYCGTCSVRVLYGRFFGGQTDDPETVRACQCRVVSDMDIAVERVPEVTEISGDVSSVVPLARDVVEVCISTAERVSCLPGQYMSVQF